jgi:hypothetical protein
MHGSAVLRREHGAAKLFVFLGRLFAVLSTKVAE